MFMFESGAKRPSRHEPDPFRHIIMEFMTVITVSRALVLRWSGQIPVKMFGSFKLVLFSPIALELDTVPLKDQYFVAVSSPTLCYQRSCN